MVRAVSLFALLLPVVAEADERPVSFRNEILPILTRQGCSAASCHGSPRGKGSLQLSLWGVDHERDHAELVGEDVGARIDLDDPSGSLLLKKPSRVVEHGGGLRLSPDGRGHELLERWIAEGCRDGRNDPDCIGIDVQPDRLRLTRSEHPVALRVQATFDDGSKRDVTHLVVFTSTNESIATVSLDGTVMAWSRGLAAVNVRYRQRLETVFVTVPGAGDGEWTSPEPANLVDERVYDQLRELRIVPANRCGDAEFVRRVHLDLVGTLPPVDVVREFLDDEADDKRTQLIDELLESPEHAAFWGQKWGDLLQVTKERMGKESALAYAGWLERSWRENLPYDEFARSLLLAEGRTRDQPLANFHRMGADHSETMEAAAVVFLGARIECAKCHNHPHERWTQFDYHGLRHFFARTTVDTKGDEATIGLGPVVDVKFPDSDRAVPAWLPGVDRVTLADEDDPRVRFADWLTATDNAHFARVEVNRLWASLFGRGIVEPFDDVRETNPPVNPPLLDTLAQEFVKKGYDRRHVLRTILLSNTYQARVRSANHLLEGRPAPSRINDEEIATLIDRHCLDCHGRDDPEGGLDLTSLPRTFEKPAHRVAWEGVLRQVTRGEMPPEGQGTISPAERRELTAWLRGRLTGPDDETSDATFFASHRPRRLSAEQLLDAICHVTGIQERFRDVPNGTRAPHLPLPDLERHEFLRTFGQSTRTGTCSCDRPTESNLGEALLIYNGRHVQDKLRNGGNRFRRAIRDKRGDAEIVEELFLAAYCRRPHETELAAALEYLGQRPNREAAYEDLCWALMTTNEFLTQH